VAKAYMYPGPGDYES
jgi:hypothetical protein